MRKGGALCIAEICTRVLSSDSYLPPAQFTYHHTGTDVMLSKFERYSTLIAGMVVTLLMILITILAVADIAVGSWCNGAASIVGTWCLAGSICTAAYYWFTCGVGPAQTCPSWRVAATMLFTGIILYMITVIANSIVLFAGLAGNDNCGQGNEQLVISYTNLAFLYVLALVLCVAFPLALATIRAYALDSAEIGGVGGVGGAAPSRRAAAGITIAHEAALTSLSQHSGEELSVTTPATSLPPPPPPPPVRRADTEQSGSHQEQPELVEESARGGQNTN